MQPPEQGSHTPPARAHAAALWHRTGATHDVALALQPHAQTLQSKVGGGVTHALAWHSWPAPQAAHAPPPAPHDEVEVPAVHALFEQQPPLQAPPVAQPVVEQVNVADAPFVMQAAPAGQPLAVSQVPIVMVRGAPKGSVMPSAVVAVKVSVCGPGAGVGYGAGGTPGNVLDVDHCTVSEKPLGA